MILVSDVDLDLLNELHTYGSVRNLKDRRSDLYEVKMKNREDGGELRNLIDVSSKCSDKPSMRFLV